MAQQQGEGKKKLSPHEGRDARCLWMAVAFLGLFQVLLFHLRCGFGFPYWGQIVLSSLERCTQRLHLTDDGGRLVISLVFFAVSPLLSVSLSIVLSLGCLATLHPICTYLVYTGDTPLGSLRSLCRAWGGDKRLMHIQVGCPFNIPVPDHHQALLLTELWRKKKLSPDGAQHARCLWTADTFSADLRFAAYYYYSGATFAKLFVFRNTELSVALHSIFCSWIWVLNQGGTFRKTLGQRWNSVAAVNFPAQQTLEFDRIAQLE